MGIAAAQQAPDVPANTGVVTGSVVDAVTGEPIPRALVQLSSDAAYSVLTDAEGKFEFRGVSASQSALTARKPGYFSSDDLREGRGERSVTQISSDGAPIFIKLTPAAVISGRVASVPGEPLENVPIKLTLEASPTATNSGRSAAALSATRTVSTGSRTSLQVHTFSRLDPCSAPASPARRSTRRKATLCSFILQGWILARPPRSCSAPDSM
ncbi:MAG: carboxypeptidase regulatory-like domain-containing protein [Acidobacteriales bacterium]|nr:carboxypeptidase regulatory-like domain-containing protein [Terriglobales bacterium]